MKLRARLGLGAVAALLLAGLVPANAGAKPSGTPPKGADGPYVYSATFTVSVNYGLRLDYGQNNIDTRKLAATVSGTLPKVQVQDTYVLAPRGGKGAVRVVSASAESTATRNDGQFADRCHGGKATVTGPAWVESAGPWLTPFVALKFPVQCTDTETGPGTGTFALDRIAADKWTTHGAPGDDTIVYKVYGDYRSPTPDVDAPCPGSVKDHTVSCAYTIKGTVTLKRLKQAPAKNNASLTKGAKKATAKVMCPMKCTLDITIRTLDGRVPITLVHLKPAPGKMTNATIPIPPKKRSVVQQSGGITMRLDYKLGAGLNYSEVRRVRL